MAFAGGFVRSWMWSCLAVRALSTVPRTVTQKATWKPLWCVMGRKSSKPPGGGKMGSGSDTAHYADYPQWLYYVEGIIMPPANIIVASNCSGADIMTGHSCMVATRRSGEDVSGLANVAAFVERLNARPALKKAQETGDQAGAGGSAQLYARL